MVGFLEAERALVESMVGRTIIRAEWYDPNVE